MKKKQEKFHLVVFGCRVRRLRQAQGLTQEQLAERMDCSLTYISKLENAGPAAAWTGCLSWPMCSGATPGCF